MTFFSAALMINEQLINKLAAFRQVKKDEGNE